MLPPVTDNPRAPIRPAPAMPALFSYGFRPFFLLAGIWAPLALALSVEMINGRVHLPTAFDPLTWHHHELLFGFVAAAIAGFLLTAIPNWTGRLPVAGWPLAGLAALWLAGRAAIATSAVIGWWPAAIIDLSFLATLAAVTLRELLAANNRHNLPIVVAITLLLLANALYHAAANGIPGTTDLALRAAVTIVIGLIGLIGGRIIPSFTRNWLAKHDAPRLPVAFGMYDKLTLAITVFALLTWIAAPDTTTAAGLIAIAALFHLVRLARWLGHATTAEPLLLVLHVAYLWIPIGLGLLAASHWLPAIPPTAALHAMTVGAMATMILAVMTRAILGHTGRDLHAGPALTTVYILITVAAMARVAASLWPALHTPFVTIAATAWIAAFIAYLGVCGPMLVTRNAGAAA